MNRLQNIVILIKVEPSFPTQTLQGPLRPSNAYMHLLTPSSLVQVMTHSLFGAKPLPEPILNHFQLNTKQ